MKITEVRVRLVGEQMDRLKAFCTVTFDEVFVVRDIKIIEGTSGLFLAMPSRKLADHCPKCHGKNHLKARFCNDCGAQLPAHRVPEEEEAASRLHVDVAHPITPECRAMLNEAVLAAYDKEARHPGGSEPVAADAAPPSDEPEPTPSDPDEVPEAAPPEPEELPPSEGKPRRFGAGLFD